MSNENGAGSGTPPDQQDQPEQALTPEQQLAAQGLTKEQVQQWLAQNIAQDVIAVLKNHTGLSDEECQAAAMVAVNEQFQVIDQIMPTLTNPDLVRSHPTLIIKMHAPNGQVGTAAGPKSLAGVTDPSHALISVALLALLQCPAARALLRVHGFTYTFMGSAEQLDKKRIILA
jgi:hypothetical protein